MYYIRDILYSLCIENKRHIIATKNMCCISIDRVDLKPNLSFKNDWFAFRSK